MVEILDELSVVSVQDLAHLLRDGLATLFPEHLWIEGQVSNFHDARSGHAYFDLVEPSEIPGRAVAARLSVALFKGPRVGVDRTLAAAGGLTLADDLQLRIRARIDFYPPNGRLQLRMDGVDPTFTLGRLAAEREQLLRALADEGLLRANRANPVPVPPLRIGLVTSVGSAAHADFTDELARSGLPFEVLERDTRVQGDGAAVDLAEALAVLATHRPDVIALVRGGGSAADLVAFDAEILARTIAGLDTPVVTGIGHEVDRAVADEVAHTVFKTPTACAAALVERGRSFASLVEGMRSEIVDRAQHVIEHYGQRQAELAGRTARAARIALARQEERLAGITGRLQALDPERVLARGWSITRLDDGRLLRSVSEANPGDRLTTLVADGTVTSTLNGVPK